MTNPELLTVYVVDSIDDTLCEANICIDHFAELCRREHIYLTYRTCKGAEKPIKVPTILYTHFIEHLQESAL